MKSHAEALAILQGRDTCPKRKRVPKPPEPASLHPHECVVIGVDAGTACSGVSTWVRGVLVGYGEIKNLDPAAIDAAIASAELLGSVAGIPLVMVHERPPPAHVIYEGRDSSGVVGANKAIESWRNAWVRAGYTMRRFIGVQVNRWRARVLGRGWGGGVARVVVRDREQQVARVIAEAEGLSAPIGPDAAPAICIGFWGTRAGEVGKVLVPTAQRRRRRSA